MMRPELIAVEAGGLTWLVREDSAPSVTLLRDPEHYLAQRELLIKDSAIVTISRVPAASPSDKRLVLRRLNYRNWRHCLRDFFRPSRAMMAMVRGLELEAAGVPTPRPLAVAEVRRCRWPRRAYLVTEEVPQALGIGWVIRQKPKTIPTLSGKLAAALAKLHDAGFSHRDLKPANILVSGDNEVTFIDLDAVRKFGTLPEGRALEDLTRLGRGLDGFPGISALLYGRFLKHYCRLRGLNWQHWWGLLRASSGLMR